MNTIWHKQNERMWAIAKKAFNEANEDHDKDSKYDNNNNNNNNNEDDDENNDIARLRGEWWYCTNWSSACPLIRFSTRPLIHSPAHPLVLLSDW